MNASVEPQELWSFGFVYLLAINVVNASAFGMVSPLIPGYVVNLGASLAFAGTVTGVFSITALFLRPIASMLGDRFNKKRILMIALSCSGGAIILYAMVPGAVWLLPARILHGMIFSISGTVSLALGADYIPQERLGEGVGYLGIGQIIGTAIGPNIGIYLMEHFTYKFCFVVSGCAILAAGLSVAALRYDYAAHKLPEENRNRKFRLQDLIAVELLTNAFFVAILAVSHGLTTSYLVLLGADRGIQNIGFYFIVNSIVLLVVRPFLGKMIDRKGVAFAVIPGYLLAAAALTMIGLAQVRWLILVAAVLMAAGAGGGMPAIQVDCLKKLDSSRKTVATGTYLIGMDTGISAGQILGGVVSDSFGFERLFIGAGILMIIGFSVYILYNRNDKLRKISKSAEQAAGKLTVQE